VRGRILSALVEYRKAKKLPNTAKILTDADGIGEMRFDFGPGYRIYFCRYSKIIILLLIGGHKKTQSADIKTVKAIKGQAIKKLEPSKEK